MEFWLGLLGALFGMRGRHRPNPNLVGGVYRTIGYTGTVCCNGRL